MFILNLTYVVPLEEVDRHLSAHNAYLNQLFQEGKLLMCGRKQPRTGGVIVARVGSLNEAESIVQGDPFHAHGIARYELVHFSPTLMVEGLDTFLRSTAESR